MSILHYVMRTQSHVMLKAKLTTKLREKSEERRWKSIHYEMLFAQA